jgi:hypothetical protein
MVPVQGTTGGYAVNLQTLSVAPAPTTAVAPAPAVTVVTEPTEGTGGKKARTEPAEQPRSPAKAPPAATVIDLTFDPEEAADAFITKYAGSYDQLLMRMNRVFGKGPNDPPGQRSQKLARVLRDNLIAYFTQNTEDPSVDDIPFMVRTNENEWPRSAWRQVLSGPDEPHAPQEEPEEEITPPSPFKLPALLTPAQKKWNDFEKRLAILGISLRDELVKLFPKLATVPDPPDLAGEIRAAFLHYYPMQRERPFGILEKIAEDVVFSNKSRVKLIDLLRTLMSRVAGVRLPREPEEEAPAPAVAAVEPVTKKARPAAPKAVTPKKVYPKATPVVIDEPPEQMDEGNDDEPEEEEGGAAAPGPRKRGKVKTIRGAVDRYVKEYGGGMTKLVQRIQDEFKDAPGTLPDPFPFPKKEATKLAASLKKWLNENWFNNPANLNTDPSIDAIVAALGDERWRRVLVYEEPPRPAARRPKKAKLPENLIEVGSWELNVAITSGVPSESKHVKMGLTNWDGKQVVAFVSNRAEFASVLTRSIPERLELDADTIRFSVPYAFCKEWARLTDDLLDHRSSSVDYLTALTLTHFDAISPTGQPVAFLPLQYTNADGNWVEFSEETDLHILATMHAQSFPLSPDATGRLALIHLRSRATPRYWVALVLYYPTATPEEHDPRKDTPQLVGFYIYTA